MAGMETPATSATTRKRGRAKAEPLDIDIEHTCGHVVSHRVPGSPKASEKAVAKLMASECPTCRDYVYFGGQEKFDEAHGPLIGSEKQREWGHYLRYDVFSAIDQYKFQSALGELRAPLEAILKERRKAGWWIENFGSITPWQRNQQIIFIASRDLERKRRLEQGVEVEGYFAFLVQSGNKVYRWHDAIENSPHEVAFCNNMIAALRASIKDENFIKYCENEKLWLEEERLVRKIEVFMCNMDDKFYPHGYFDGSASILRSFFHLIYRFHNEQWTRIGAGLRSNGFLFSLTEVEGQRSFRLESFRGSDPDHARRLVYDCLMTKVRNLHTKIPEVKVYLDEAGEARILPIPA